MHIRVPFIVAALATLTFSCIEEEEGDDIDRSALDDDDDDDDGDDSGVVKPTVAADVIRHDLGPDAVRTSTGVSPQGLDLAAQTQSTAYGWAAISGTPSVVAVPIGLAGSTTICWNTQGLNYPVWIRVSVGNGAGQLFTKESDSGSACAQAPWIVADNTYTFRIRDDNNDWSFVYAEGVVTGVVGGGGSGGSGGDLCDPSLCPSGSDCRCGDTCIPFGLDCP